MHKIKTPFSLIIITVFICLLGIFLPGILLQHKNTTQIDIAATLSSEYYSGTTPAISKNASAQLSTYEKMELISGAWESNTTEADISESSLSEYEAVSLAQTALDELYENNVYPCSLTSGFKSWYSWNATLYKATDNSFHTYSAYYWVITFDLYDSQETHTVLMMEDGTILCAYTNQRVFNSDTISNYVASATLFGKIFSLVTVTSDVNVSSLPVYPTLGLDTADMTLRDCSIYIVGTSNIEYAAGAKNLYQEGNNQCQFYYVYQLVKPNAYIYTIIPYQP